MLDKRQRVLLVTRNFPPLVGGMEKLMHALYNELSKYYQVDLIGPKGSSNHIPPAENAYQCSFSPITRCLVCIQIMTMFVVGKYRPVMVIAGSGAVAPAVFLAAKIFKKPSMIYLHGLDLVVNSAIYRTIFIPAIRKFDMVVCNSSSTKSIAVDKSVPNEKLEVVNPGVTLPKCIAGVSTGVFQKRLGISAQSKVILSVGRLVPRKGLIQFLRYSFMKILSDEPDCHLAIIGADAKNAIQKSQDCNAALHDEIVRLNLENNVSLLGEVQDDFLENAYICSDVFILPAISVPGDVEGFGMVALEAAAHGLPTVAFSVGGIGDAVSNGESGRLITEGDYDNFTEVVLDQLRNEEDSITRENCIRYAKNHSWDKFGDRLNSLCSRLVNSW